MPNIIAFRDAVARDKTGLALSGGGFRAALFHIGVLARLAELDLLRGIDVISTVSGGSIIGAYYYLKVKELLEARRADRLTPSPAAYIRLVQEVEIEFLAAVRKNLRMRTFLDRRKNARMMREGYSSTDRLAELFTELLYAPFHGKGSRLLLRDLPIQPAGALEPGNKTPTLILNSTALNTGHLWQFSGAFVGEQASQYERHYVDIPILPKLHFASPNLNAAQQASLAKLTLGQAVAASCCVPGLFEPLGLTGLYRTADDKEIVVRLADGGVFDNQGLASLFAEECDRFICSDASDLLESEAVPSNRLLNTAMRANKIMMDRIRNKILDHLFDRSPETYAFVHLGAAVDEAVFPVENQRLLYALTHIRTDLDSFTDKEAYTLMYYGYAVSGSGFQDAPAPCTDWRFLAIRDWLRDEEKTKELLLHLDVGAKQLFKVFFLKKPLPYGIVIGAALPPSALTLYLLSWLPPLALGLLALALLSILAFTQNARIIHLIDKAPVLRRNRQRLAKALIPLGVPALLGAVASAVTWLHLRVFDRLFLRYGRVTNQGD